MKLFVVLLLSFGSAVMASNSDLGEDLKGQCIYSPNGSRQVSSIVLEDDTNKEEEAVSAKKL